MTLPECSWRKEEVSPGRHKCTHPRIMTLDSGVPNSICATCHLANTDGQPISGLVHSLRNRKNTAMSGPGTELVILLGMLGFPVENCTCRTRANLMNEWGPSGCRQHRNKIVNWLRKEQSKKGWKDKLKAASLAVTSGLAFKLNPLDPAPGLLDEAIRRAEAKINNAQGNKPSENSTVGTAEGNHA